MEFETISLILKSITGLSQLGIAVVLIKYIYDTRTDRRKSIPDEH